MALRPERSRMLVKPLAIDSGHLKGQWTAEVASAYALLKERAQTEEALRMTIDTLSETVQHLLSQHVAIVHGLMRSREQLSLQLEQEREGRVTEMKMSRLLSLQIAIMERQLSEAKHDQASDPTMRQKKRKRADEK